MDLGSLPPRPGGAAPEEPLIATDISRLTAAAAVSFEALLREVPPFLTADATQTPAAQLLCESIAQEDTPKAVRIPQIRSKYC